ncbi:MAG: 3-hydroxyacyl-CoA dehydrogenase family protein [Caldiserica bacterium]|nr:3-hydroxyacyl-CoA dehydrogenase family protein [Caldisericota bacterium]
MEIRRIAVFGAGVMGAGIAQDAAAHGLEVVLVDQTESGLSHARQSIENSLNLELQRWGITGSEKKILLSHIKFTVNPGDVGSVDLVIEAIPDDLGAKQDLFAQLEAQFEHMCPGEITYVSNTAILSITDIALKMVNKERLVGMHFLAPVPAIKLVEMVRGVHTSQTTVDRAKELARRMGKTPVDVLENPGYITARLVVPLINEAIMVYQEGTASKEDIDVAMRLGFGFNKGPFALADQIGLDIVLGWSENLFRELGETRYRPQALIRNLARRGHLGVKTGKGFYSYENCVDNVEEKI